MLLDREVGLNPSDIVSDGDPSHPKRGDSGSPPFRPMYCGQTAGWIKMPFGTEVGLSPGHILLDGDPAPSPAKGGRAPNFWPMSIVAKWLDGTRCHLVQK